MLKNAYLLAKIGADTAENEQNFAVMLTTFREVTSPWLALRFSARRRARRSSQFWQISQFWIEIIRCKIKAREPWCGIVSGLAAAPASALTRSARARACAGAPPPARPRASAASAWRRGPWRAFHRGGGPCERCMTTSSARAPWYALHVVFLKCKLHFVFRVLIVRTFDIITWLR